MLIPPLDAEHHLVDTHIDRTEMQWCLDLSVANGNQTNKSIDVSQTLMV